MCSPAPRQFFCRHLAPALPPSKTVRPIVNSNPDADEILELMRALIGYRMSRVRQTMEKVNKVSSMLHVDVLLLIYHLGKIARGGILEIGSFLGGSAIAAALGARESGGGKKIVTIEPGG